MAKTPAHPLIVGSILTASWGYEQTNVDFYEVTALNGSTMVTLRQLETERDYSGTAMRGTAMPKPGQYRADRKPMRRKVTGTGTRHLYVAVADRTWATPWDGTPRSFTTYA